ncbi:MAG: dipeptidase PepV [Peptococcaceae bacterium]|jgi:succinyl-diaminopimelate desuccinylase|nr:dipeptidase PepV [Peptococcaceae bacterium]
MVLESQVEKEQEALIHNVQSCVRIRSVRTPEQAAPGAPFGPGVQQALEWFLAEAARMGFKTRNIDGYVGTVEFGSGDVFGVMGHLDVVPEGDGWSVPPYAAAIKDGKLYGRGASDDKGPTLAVLHAMKVLKDSQWPLRRTIRLILGTDEESGWADLDYYRQREELPSEGFTPDAKFPLIHAEKGLLQLELSKKTKALSHIVSLTGGERPNIVPDHCHIRIKGIAESVIREKIEAFSCPAEISLDLLPSDNQEQTLLVKGAGAHGSLPQEGKNAALYAVQFLRTLPLDREEQALLQWISDQPGNGFHGEGFDLALSDEVSGKLSLNVGILEIQTHTTRLVADIRYPVTCQGEGIVEQISRVCKQEDYTVNVLVHQLPHHVAKDSDLVQTLLAAYHEVTGKDAYALAIGGGTYAKALPQGVAFGAVFPGEPDMAHCADEYIRIDHLLLLTKIYTQALFKVAAVDTSGVKPERNE